MPLDLKDKKILYCLDEDSSQPLSSIAKKVHLSKQVVAYRIEDLKRRGILLKTCAIINPARVGYEFFKFYIKYKVMTKEDEKRMLEELNNNSRVGYMCICDGRFDLFVGVWARNTHDLYAISKVLFNKYKTNFEEIVLSTVENAFNSKRGYLVDDETAKKVPLFGGELSEISIDEIDRKILRLLAEDSRRKHVAIAQIVKLTPATVSYRIKNMKKNRVIEGARIVLDKSKIGYVAFKVLIKTGAVEEKEVNRFINHAVKQKNIVDIDLTLGDWDLELDIESENYEVFHQLLLDLRTLFPNVIYSYDSLLIFKEYTYDYFPLGK